MSTPEGRRYIRTDRFASLKDHVFDVVRRGGAVGAVTPEIVGAVNRGTPDGFITYSNPVSGALSRLHNVDQRIVRLKGRRQGFNVYVLPEYVQGRDHYPARPPRPPAEPVGITDEMVERLAVVLQGEDHDEGIVWSLAFYRKRARRYLTVAFGEGEST